MSRQRFYTDLTPAEKKAIDALKRLDKIWPDTLRLFSWSGTLVIEDTEGSDGDGRIATIGGLYFAGISNEGGDPDEVHYDD